MIVGGTFNNKGGKASMIVKMLAKYLNMVAINGGSLAKLADATELTDDLNIWMPNVSNEVGKIYPHKKRGSIVICSKVLRPDTTLHDAVARIFKMHGNAVIAIDTGPDVFKFTLIDALGNVWIKTSKLDKLAKAIREFEKWMKGVQRVKSNRMHKGGVAHATSTFDKDLNNYYLHKLCEINTDLSDKVILSAKGARYFGNLSTRCEYLFPSIKLREHYIYVSKRNVSKEHISEKDFVCARLVGKTNDVMYMSHDGEAKPSVDTPIQLRLYEELPDVMCMIHGHAYVADAPITEHYYPCGDIREVDAALAVLENKTMCINLRNHGFLAVGTNLADFEDMLKNTVMLPKVVGRERICFTK